jgi:hypothetical protein
MRQCRAEDEAPVAINQPSARRPPTRSGVGSVPAPYTQVVVSREFVNRLAARFAMFLCSKALTCTTATRIRTARELPFEGHESSFARCRGQFHRHGAGLRLGLF